MQRHQTQLSTVLFFFLSLSPPPEKKEPLFIHLRYVQKAYWNGFKQTEHYWYEWSSGNIWTTSDFLTFVNIERNSSYLCDRMLRAWQRGAVQHWTLHHSDGGPAACRCCSVLLGWPTASLAACVEPATTTKWCRSRGHTESACFSHKLCLLSLTSVPLSFIYLAIHGCCCCCLFFKIQEP